MTRELPQFLRHGARVLLELDLTRGLRETPPSSPVEAIRARHVPSLRAVIETLEKAADDDHVAGLVAHVGHRQPTLAQAGELRAAVQKLRASGKPTVCWAETFGELGPGNVGYHLASAFEQVWMQPSGDLGLVGVTAQAVFIHDALGKIGVDTQLGQRHEYKTAANIFLESGMTDAEREMTTALVESAMATIVTDVAAGRRLTEADVRAAVDTAPLSADDAVASGLIDRIGYRDEVYAALRERLGDVQLKYVERYRKGPAALTRSRPPVPGRSRPVVAVVQASGPIHLGRSRGGSPLTGRSVGSDSVGAALRAAGTDDAVKAVVLRVDSPGGSYVASDAVRRDVLELRRTGKPVVASMASVAASGGYYIAMPADTIVANAGTLTGSIGVLAGKQVIRDALERVGVHRESVSAGRYADMFSTQRPFDDDEWQRLEAWLDRVYDDFTGKAAADRGMPAADLRAVARGRVWTGADAARIGLVDELGGLSHAVEVACRRAGLTRSAVDVRAWPRPNPVERLMPAESSESPRAAGVLDEMPLLDRALDTLGVSVPGVLTMPVSWQLR